MSARIELRGIARATVPSEMNALAIFKRTRRSEPCFTYMSFLEKSSVVLAQVVRVGGDSTDDVTMHITGWSSEALHDLFRKKIRVWWPHREEWRVLAQEGEEAALAVLWRRHTLSSSASKAQGGKHAPTGAMFGASIQGQKLMKEARVSLLFSPWWVRVCGNGGGRPPRMSFGQTNLYLCHQ